MERNGRAMIVDSTANQLSMTKFTLSMEWSRVHKMSMCSAISRSITRCTFILLRFIFLCVRRMRLSFRIQSCCLHVVYLLNVHGYGSGRAFNIMAPHTCFFLWMTSIICIELSLCTYIINFPFQLEVLFGIPYHEIHLKNDAQLTVIMSRE